MCVYRKCFSPTRIRLALFRSSIGFCLLFLVYGIRSVGSVGYAIGWLCFAAQVNAKSNTYIILPIGFKVCTLFTLHITRTDTTYGKKEKKTGIAAAGEKRAARELEREGDRRMESERERERLREKRTKREKERHPTYVLLQSLHAAYMCRIR